MRPVFPFSAIVGQEEMKLALLLVSIDPTIGGVMVFGDRGTGKSTAVRALASLLPPMKAVTGCRYGCDPLANGALCDECRAKVAAGHPLKSATVAVPMVDLPLGATEDRLVGALDLERALTSGEKAFEPGLLARAHRGFLDVDEVNLLEDHLVDLLLDAAATGENVVEREGVSIRHPAKFVLVGSGNPEEGELRPQLLDRFGLAVDVRTPASIAARIDVIKRRDAFDRDANAFMTLWAKADAKVRRLLEKARTRLDALSISDAVLERAATLCAQLGTDGLRGELTLMRTSRALAAFEGATEVTIEHVRRIAPMALRHRLRRNVLDDADSTTRVERAIADLWGASPMSA